MSSLQAHKRRIKSIDSTFNIARAMELVSSVKLKKLRNKYDLAINYLDTLQNVINEVLCLSETKYKINEDGINLNVVITSNLGLCGQYNEEIIKLLSKEEKSEASYIVFGEKGKKYLKSNGYDVLFSYGEYNDFENSDASNEFSDKLVSLLKQGKIKNINVIYTKYINNLKYVVVKESIYPFESNKEKSETSYLIEIDAEEMVNYMISLYVKTKMNSILLNSLLSENASRNNAMKNAKDNANDLKEELILIYNKFRQQHITNELSDIVNGM